MTAARARSALPTATLARHLAGLLEDDHGRLVGFYDRANGTFGNERLGRFLRRALGAAQALRDQGLGAGRIALVVGRSPEHMWLGYLAVTLAGGVPVVHAHRPAFDSQSRATLRLDGALAALGPEAVIVAADPAPVVGQVGDRAVLALASSCPASDGPVQLDVEPDQPVHLQMTSGSTTPGRPVVVTHRALLSNVAACRAAIGDDPHDSYVSWLPLYHDMGLVGTCLTSLLCGADLYLLSPYDFLRDPASWLRGLSDVGGTVACSPDFGFDLAARRLAGGDLAGIDLSGWRRAICGGEPVSATTLRRFVDVFAPHGFRAEAFAPSYGLAEATVYVSSWPEGRPPYRLVVTRSSITRLGDVEVVDEGEATRPATPTDAALVEVVALGPTGGVPIDIVGPDGASVGADDRCGEVVVAGDSVTAGYLRPDGTVERFDPAALPTGDLGFFHDGQLYVVERAKNLVIRHGENYSARALEEDVARVVGLAPAQVLVVDSDVRPGHGRLVALLEPGRNVDAAPLVERLRAHLDDLELPLDEVLVVVAGSLPRTTSGKKRHHEVRRALEEGLLRVRARGVLRAPAVDDHGEPLEVDVVDRRHRLLAIVERFAREHHAPLAGSVTPAAHLQDDLLLDSLAVYELAVEMEEAFEITVDDDELRLVSHVEDLLLLLDAKVRATRRGEVGGCPSGERRGLRAAAERLADGLPSVRVIVEEQRARQVRIGERWLSDFASCNYLGLDLHPRVLAAIEPAVRAWGVHPSWTRAVASPAPYRWLERELADLVGAGDTVVFPTVTLLHYGVLPRLAGPRGAILLDGAAHHSLQEAATLARGSGTTVRTWRHQDLGHLDEQLRSSSSRGPRIVVVDGVYSMSGEYADLRSLVAVADRHDATVYVDDAHGFGVLGRDPSPARPYGTGGAGLAAHQGVAVDRLVYVGGLSKAFSSMAAFVTCSARHPRRAFEAASTAVFSGPVPVASLASALAGLEVNRDEGDELRDRLHHLTVRLVDGLTGLGFPLEGHSHFPIVNVVLGRPSVVKVASEVLWEAGVLSTPSVFPAAPLATGGVRFTVTAANEADEVDRVLEAMAGLREGVDAPLILT